MAQQQEKISHKWQAKEFEPHPHQKSLSIFFLGAAAVFFVFSALSGNFSGAVISILAGFVLYVFSQKQPQNLTFQVTPKGIRIGEELYDYETLDSFWIFYDPPEIKEVVIKTHAYLTPKLHLPLENEDPNEIREILQKYLPEEKQNHSIIDNIARGLGF